MKSDDCHGCDRTYAKLQEALMEAETLKKEALAERNRRRRTERELSLALIRVMNLLFFLPNIYSLVLVLPVSLVWSIWWSSFVDSFATLNFFELLACHHFWFLIEKWHVFFVVCFLVVRELLRI